MDCNFNRVRLCGRISSDPALSHVNHGETFYRFVLSVQRLSGQCDDLPVIVPRQLLRACPLGRGDAAAVTGQLRSFNNRSGQGRRLIISVFAQTLERGSGVPCNRIQLGGSLCKPPNYRRTPLGREICDLILAVNRRYGRADYLPCIAWGAVAQQTRSSARRCASRGGCKAASIRKISVHTPRSARPMRCRSCARRSRRNSCRNRRRSQARILCEVQKVKISC